MFAKTVEAQQRIGYVVDVSGDWRVNSSAKSISIGQTVNSGDVIGIHQKSKRGAYVTIVNFQGTIIAARHCNISSDCDAPIKLPPRPESRQSKLSTILDSVMSLLFGEPDRYSVHRVRGAPEMVESVVLLTNRQIDLSSVFQNVDEGHYWVAFQRIQKDGSIEDDATRLSLDWNPATRSLLAKPDLDIGLFQISLVNRDGDPVSVGTEAWIFIANPGRYPQALETFDNISAMAKQWGKDVKVETVRSLLRAQLYQIAFDTRTK